MAKPGYDFWTSWFPQCSTLTTFKHLFGIITPATFIIGICVRVSATSFIATSSCVINKFCWYHGHFIVSHPLGLSSHPTNHNIPLLVLREVITQILNSCRSVRVLKTPRNSSTPVGFTPLRASKHINDLHHPQAIYLKATHMSLFHLHPHPKWKDAYTYSTSPTILTEP